MYVHLLKTRLCYVGPFSVLIVLLLLPYNKHYFGLCSVLLYYIWQTRVKETLVEDIDGVHDPHAVHAHLCSREPFSSFNPFTLKTHQFIIPLLK